MARGVINAFAAFILGSLGYLAVLLLAALLVPGKPVELVFLAVFGLVAGAVTARSGGLGHVVLGAMVSGAVLWLRIILRMPVAAVGIVVAMLSLGLAALVLGLTGFAAGATVRFFDRRRAL